MKTLVVMKLQIFNAAKLSTSMVVVINVHTQQPTGWDQQDTSSVGLCINTLSTTTVSCHHQHLLIPTSSVG